MPDHPDSTGAALDAAYGGSGLDAALDGAYQPTVGETASSGPRVPGNVDLLNRPSVKMPDGSIATVRSLSFGTDEGEVLVPTVSDDGRLMSDDEAVANYRKTGKHLGIYGTPAEATAAGVEIHHGQAKLLKERELDTRLENALWAADLLSDDVEKRAKIYRLSQDTGVSQEQLEKNYDQIKAAWDAATMYRSKGSDFSQAAIPESERGKTPGQRFREKNPTLAKLLLEHPDMAWVVKDGQLNILARALQGVKDMFFEGQIAQEQLLAQTQSADPEKAKEAKALLDRKVAGLQELQEQLSFTQPTERVLVDEKSRRMQDGWIDIGGTLSPGLMVPRAVMVPVLRAQETWAQLEINKAHSKLIDMRRAGLSTFNVESEILDLEQKAVRRDYSEGAGEQVLTDVAEGMTSFASALSEGGVIGAATGAAAAALTFGVTRNPALSRAVGGRVATLGVQAGTVYGTFELERGGAMREFMHAKKHDGSPAMDFDTAALAADVYGVLSTSIEFGGGVEAQLLNAGSKKAFAKALIKSPAFLGAMKRFAKTAIGEGMGEELLQDATQQAVEYFARSHGSGGWQSTAEADIKPEQVLIAGLKGTTGSMGMGGVSVLVDAHQQRLEADKSMVDGNQLRVLAGLTESPVAQQVPKVVAEIFREHAARGGTPATHVYVEGGAMVRLFQEKGVDVDEAARELIGEDGAQQIRDAVVQNGFVEVPTERYIEKWVVGSQTAKSLVDDTKLDPALLTTRQAKERAPEIEKLAQELADQAEVNDTHTAKSQFDEVEEKLVLSGKYTPHEAAQAMAPLRAIVRTSAAAFGIPAAKLFEKYGIAFGAGDEALSVTLGAPVGSRFLSQDWRGQSPEQQQRSLFIDRTTGALNDRAWARREKSAKTVGHVSIEGVKFTNDTQHKHEAGDALYRAAARALAPLGLELFKVKGDFVVPDLTQEELDAAIAKANGSPELQGFKLSGIVGEGLRPAAAAHNKRKAELESQKLRAPRGGRPMNATGEFAGGGAKLEGTTLPAYLRESFRKTPTNEAFEETFTDRDSGLLNKDGFEATPDAPFYATADLDNLRDLNAIVGEEQADEAIAFFSNLMREQGAHEFFGAKVGPDEYNAKGRDEAKLKAWFAKVQETADRVHFPIELNETMAAYLGLKPGPATLRGLPFSFGVGQNLDHAERAAAQNKSEREAAGLRGEGTVAGRIVQGPAQSSEGDGQRAGEGDGQAVPGPAGEEGQAGAEPELAPDFGRQRYFDPGRLEQPQAAAVGPKLDTTDLFAGQETLEKYGLPAVKLDPKTGRPVPGSPHGNGRYGLNLIRDIYIALEKRALEVLGGEPIAPDDFSDAAKEKLAAGLANIVKAQLATDPAKSGEGWYDDMFKQEALGNVAKLYPELAKDKAKRGIFTAILAITSGDQKVIQNFNSSLPILDFYLKKKRMPAKPSELKVGLGKNGNAALGLLGRVQTLVDKLGEQGALDFLLKEDTVENMKQVVKDLKLDVDLKGFNDKERVPMASVYLSPKFGTFWSNLMGADGYLTMDLWWSRTINTMRGNVVTVPKRVAIDNFKKQMANQQLFAGQMKQGDKAKLVRSLPAAKNITDAQAFKEAVRLEEIVRAQKNYGKAWKQKSKAHLPVVLPTAYERSGNELYKQRYEKLNQAPFNPADRGFQLGVARRAQEMLQADLGRPISIADMQALSWFYEQRLIEKLGGENDSDTTYGEAAAANVKARSEGREFATAADVAAVRPVLEAERRKRRAAVEARRARQEAKAGQGRAGRTRRLEQFSTPEQSNDQAARERVLQDMLLEAGLSEVDPKKLIKGKAFQRLERAAKLLELLDIRDVVDIPATPGELHDALDDRMEYFDPREQSVAWDMVRSVGDLEGLLGYIRAALGAEEFNQTEHTAARRAPGQTRGPKSDAYAHFGGSTEESWAHELMLELDNESLTAGPESADIPASKDLPGQAANEAATRTGLGTKLKDLGEQLPKIALRLEQRRLEAPVSDDGVPKGYTDVLRTGIEKVFRIALNKDADMSTWLHESGHVYLELLADLAERGDAPGRVKDNWAGTMKYLGIENRTQLTRDHHERFARSFEAYLREGKAPSARLVGAFTTFKLWLKKVYRDVRELRVELNDEIRGVFDRLLATEDEVMRQARRQGTFTPHAKDVIGMTDAEYDAYSGDLEDRLSYATEQADFRAMKDAQRETEAWWKAELKEETKKAEEEYEQLQARKVQRGLRGQLVAGVRGEPIGLDRQTVYDLIGEPAAKKAKLLLKKNGASPDSIAKQFGYDTGKALLDDQLELPDKSTWSHETAYDRMLEKHPDVMADRTKLAELVGKGLHGDRTEKWLLKELVAFKAKIAKPGAPVWTKDNAPVESIRLAAKKIAERTKIGRLTPGNVLQQERSEREQAVKAATKGEYGQAFAHTMRALQNMYLWRELQEAREEREKFLDLAQSLTKDAARSKLGKARPIYRDTVDALLAALQLAEEREGTPGIDIADLVSAMDADAQTVGFDEAELNRIGVGDKGYKSLTVAEMRTVNKMLLSVKAAARGKNTAIYGDGRMDAKELEDQLIAESPGNLPPLGPIASSESAKGPWRKFKGWVAGVDGSLLRPEQMLKWMGDTWVRALFDPLNEAKKHEIELLKGPVKRLNDAFDAIPTSIKNRWNEAIDGKALFPKHEVAFEQDLEAPSTRGELIMLALNMGNESNLARLTIGRNITLPQLQQALDLLTKEELDLVQSIWDAAEDLWPLAAELEERDSGLKPEPLERRPLITRHGTYNGGYFPAVYDWRVEATGEKQAAAAVAQLMDPRYVRPGTAHNHLEGRVDGFTGVISLEPATILRGISQAAHDIAYREAVKSVGGLILRPAIRAELGRRLGPERAKQFLQWVKDVGQMRGLEGAERAGELLKLTRALRGNTVIAVLGYSLTTATGDLANLVAAIPRSQLPLKHWGAAMLEFMASPMDSIKEVHDLSGEMMTRRSRQQDHLKQQVRDLPKGGWWGVRGLRWVKDNAFAFLEFTDLMTSTPIWMGAYRHAQAKGLDEAESIRAADAVIRENFPGNSAVDLPGLLRDKGFVGQSVMFYRYFSVVYNTLRDITHPLHTAEDGVEVAKRVPKVAGRMLAFMTAALVFSELLSGRGPEDDEEVWEWYFRKLIFGGLQSIPLLGEATTALESKVLGKRTNPRGAPVVSLMTQVADGLMKLDPEDDEATKTAIILLQTFAPAAGVPMSQPVRTTTGIAAQQHDPARNPVELVGDLWYGRREDQPRTLPAIIGELIEGSER
jgi:GGDEF domain-containing protein